MRLLPLSIAMARILLLCDLTLVPKLGNQQLAKKLVFMATVKLSDDFINDAKATALAMHRSIPKQIEHWARLGKIVEENPDLPIAFIKDILISLKEVEAGEVSEYQFD